MKINFFYNLILIICFILINSECYAQEPYSHCYEQNEILRKPIIKQWNDFINKESRTQLDTIKFRKIQFDLLINNFLYWGETGLIDINIDPFYKYYDSMTRILKHFDELEFDKRPDVAEKLKKRKPDSFYLKGPETFSIPEEVAKKTRFGNLDIGKSIDLYYMKPLVVFYDTAWEQNLRINYGRTEKVNDKWQTVGNGVKVIGKCECQAETPDCGGTGAFQLGHEGNHCQYQMFKERLAIVYDIKKEDMEKLGVRGKDMRYFMFRKLTITRQNCFYEVQFYKDIFEQDTGKKIFQWFINKFKNKEIVKGAFEPKWEKDFLLNTTLNQNPMVNDWLITSSLSNFSHKLCQMEERKYGTSKIDISKKFQKHPEDSLQWNNGLFMHTWQIMDFGDNNPISMNLYNILGDHLLFRNPYNFDYYTLDRDYYYVKKDTRPTYKSFSKHRRYLYYNILRYPDYSIRYRIDDIYRD